MENKDKKPIIISRDLSNVIKSFLVPQLKFVKIIYENGKKERSVNLNDAITIIYDDYFESVSYRGKEINLDLCHVVNFDEIRETISKFMVKITDNFYVRNLNKIKLVEKTEDGKFKIYLSSIRSYVHSLTKEEASIFGF